MAIRSFRDFAQTKSYGEVQTLPKGGYVMRILGATVEENSIGQYVKIQMDIAEGEYRDFYRRDYENQQTEDKKWHCNYLLNVPKDDGTEQDGWTKRKFKTFTEALEESNPGYHFDWDEAKFKGLLVGGLFNLRQYEKSDGTIGESTNLAAVCKVDTIRSGRYTLPKDKLLAAGQGKSGAAVTMDEDGFMNVPDGLDAELPFA